MQNRRVLFTGATANVARIVCVCAAPRQYARKLSSLLIDAGARPVWLPAVEITSLPPEERSSMDVVLRRLPDFSHVAFTSRNGIEAVFARLQELWSSEAALLDYVKASGVRLCALGADGEKLREYGLEPHIQPPQASTMGLVEWLEAQGSLKGAKILCPVPSVRGGLVEPVVVPRFLKALTDGGAEATRLDAYVTQPGCRPKDCLPELDLLKNGHIYCIVFTSTAEAQGLAIAAGSLSDLQKWISQTGTLLAAHGPFTAAGNYNSFDGIVHALQAVQ